MPPRLPPRSPASEYSTDSLDSGMRMTSLSPNGPYLDSTGFGDPRSSSSQSLLPIEPDVSGKRKLLLIYIHGFLGAESSFQSFPAHVHSLLTVSLAESHVIHTKIYPRYKSRRKISFARDDFSRWLLPHESENTDVVLLGHSLGGILGAEVVLIPCHTPESADLFQHKILGLIAFDTPFLGMHPSVITTGIASLFRGAPDEPTASTNIMMNDNPSEVFDSSRQDPNYNPGYQNDIHLPVHKNKWDRAWYFWNKHANELGRAARSYVTSHLEFGGCLADYPGLKRRYETVRLLEDVDELQRKKGPNGKLLRRTRFVNYYSASSGRIKENKTVPTKSRPVASETKSMDGSATPKQNSLNVESISSRSPGISVEEHRDDGVFISKDLSNIDIDQPQLDDSVVKATTVAAIDTTPSQLADTADALKAQDQQTLPATESSHQSMAIQADQFDDQNTPIHDEATKSATSTSQANKKDRKFCTLPSKDPKTGAVDRTWVKVYMEGVDEVVAHTSLFFIGETYAKLVGDVAERIAEWVQEDATNRIILSEFNHNNESFIGGKGPR